MKRLHVHLHVDDLAKSVGFHSQLLAADPARLEGDHAKWMLEDPPVNFAISTRGVRPGIDHLGIQTDDPVELMAMQARAEAAGVALRVEGETTCCCARSEQHGVTDPQGIAWEHLNTLANMPVFDEARTPASTGSACCSPTATAAPASARPAATGSPSPRGKPIGMPIESSGSCC